MRERRNEGKRKKKRNKRGEITLLGPGGVLDQQKGISDQQDRIISKLKLQAAQREEQIRGLERQNKGLNELCDSQSACIREVCGGLRESNERKSASIQEPVQVNHSELLASPRPSQESQLNEHGDVGARRGGGRKKDPPTWFANLDASTAAAFCANRSKKT
jgi:uncharacterized protein (DUF3084 family)